MRGYIRGMVIGGIVGAAASMMLLNYYEPRSARSLMRKGHGALRYAARKMRHYTGL
jgi:gas vesicle protein